MHSVLNVARYVVEHCPDLTAMKLEKLVYYCQSWALVWDGKPLFKEDFEAWANGPVCPALYKTHIHQFSISNDFLKDYQGDFDEDELETMNAVIKFYGNKNAIYLSELTHKERPWKETRGDLPLGSRSNKVIPELLMQDYYGGL
ncbi:Panacea domain-containing protein [Lentilactobacillus raoultii]|uniref:Panacea domain-containing protein n=1 Tax=Lentilactobacillus raoultii TaxID=1987503 RepID=A0ABW3PJE7_9LACO|nr:type II toxin-antitoxin system antitoxin SocA domain-containing protein [Lentilactobacillus raoultii]